MRSSRRHTTRSPAGEASLVRIRAHAKINFSLRVIGVGPTATTCSTPSSRRARSTTSSRSKSTTARLRCRARRRDCRATTEPGLAAGDLVWDGCREDGAPGGVRVRIAKRSPPRVASAAAARTGRPRSSRSTALGHRARCGPLESARPPLGADVPFFLRGGTARGLDRGDDIQPMADLPTLHVVVVFPAFGVSTQAAFEWFDEDEAGRLRNRGWGCLRQPWSGRGRRRASALGAAPIGSAARRGSSATICKRPSRRITPRSRVSSRVCDATARRMPRCRAAALPSLACSSGGPRRGVQRRSSPRGGGERW